MNYNEFQRLAIDASLQKNVFECISFLIFYFIVQTSIGIMISTRLLVKKEKKLSIFPLIALCTLILIILLFDYVFFYRNNFICDIMLRTMWVCCTIAILHIYFYGSILKKLLAFFIAIFSETFLGYVAFYTNLLISDDDIYMWMNVARNGKQLACLILFFFVLYFETILFLWIAKRPIASFRNKDIKNNRFLLYLFIFFYFLPTIVNIITDILRVEFLFAEIIVLLLTFFTLIGILEYIYNKNLKFKETITKDIYEKQQNHYKALEHSIEKTDQLRHDIDSHVRMLQFLQEGGMESQEFEKELLKKYAETKQIIYTNNTIIDSLIYSYTEQYKYTPVDIVVCINLPKQIEKIELEIHALLNQLFEFASEQCKDNQITDRASINLHGSVVKNYLFLIMECSKTDLIDQSKRGLLCRGRKQIYMKKIKAMKNICHRNEGSFNLEESDNTVKITAMLQVEA